MTLAVATRLRITLFVIAAFIPGVLAAETLTLIDAEASVASGFEHRIFGNATRFENVTIDGHASICATGNLSASGLLKRLEIDPYVTPNVSWQWRVDRLQPSADLRVASKEDFAAAIFFIFAKPRLWFRKIRSLGYVWTNDAVAADTVLASVHRPERSRFIILRSGKQGLKQWQLEQRNLLDDYRRVYNEDPPQLLAAVSIWADNDQTEEPVVSYFGSLKAMD